MNIATTGCICYNVFRHKVRNRTRYAQSETPRVAAPGVSSRFTVERPRLVVVIIPV